MAQVTPPDLPTLPIDAPRSGLFAGVDIGGTNQSVALARGDGQVLVLLRRRLRPGGTAQDVLDNVVAMLREALAGAAAAGDGGHLAGLGIGFGGPVDQRGGIVVDSHHVAGWTGFPLRDTLAEAFGAPVALDNDANAAALGEARFGAGRGHEDVLYVNVGTGIGAGVLLGGRLYRGARGMAGEIGHVTVLPDGPPCDCGKRGCLEAVASGRSIGRRGREAATQLPAVAAELIRLAGGRAEDVASPHVFAAAAAGDALGRRLVEETGDYLGLALANAANLLDPSAIVLGGGLAETGDLLFVPLRRALAAHLMPGLPAPEVLRAALGYDAGVLGAVALALQNDQSDSQ
jgi:glucokinase